MSDENKPKDKDTVDAKTWEPGKGFQPEKAAKRAIESAKLSEYNHKLGVWTASTLKQISENVTTLSTEVKDLKTAVAQKSQAAPGAQPDVRNSDSLAAAFEELLAEQRPDNSNEVRAARRHAATQAADAAHNFIDDNDGPFELEDLLDRLWSITPGGTDEQLIAAIGFALRAFVLGGSQRSLDETELERALSILAEFLRRTSAQTSVEPRAACAARGNAPVRPSSAVLQDSTDLSALLLGAAPSFAGATTMQADAQSASMAGLNRVSDSHRQDGVNMAIAACAAARVARSSS